jgi:hypothetical protein
MSSQCGHGFKSVLCKGSPICLFQYHLQEYKETGRSVGGISTNKEPDKPNRLPPIQEFQREFRLGKERSSSTRIRYEDKIIPTCLFISFNSFVETVVVNIQIINLN